MKSIKILTAFCICLTLTGCFHHVNENSEDTPENIRVQISNAYSDSDFNASIKDDSIIYELDSIYEEAKKTDSVSKRSLLAVNFDRDYHSCTYAYYGGNVWAYAVNRRNPKYFTIEPSVAEPIIEKLCTYGALSCISNPLTFDEEFSADFSQISNTSKLPEHNPDCDSETLCFYASRGNTVNYVYSIEGDNLYYYQSDERKTDAEINGTPYYQTTNEYEYATNGKESWYRPEMYDVFYPAESFEGDYQPVFLTERLKNEYRFEHGFPVSVACNNQNYYNDSDYCEIYRNDNETVAVIFNEEKGIQAGWFYNDETMKVMLSFQSYPDKEFDMTEYIQHAHEHTEEIENQKKMDANKSAEEWLSSDLEKIGMYGVYQDFQSALLPDTSKIKNLDTQPETVQNYIDHIANNQPFTYELLDSF